jgi:hypothetical protein
MMMYLAGIPVHTIMLVGRWLSDAFLCYIEKQIKEFTVGVSEKMLLCNTFYIPLRPWTTSDTANSKSRRNFITPQEIFLARMDLYVANSGHRVSKHNYMTDLLLMADIHLKFSLTKFQLEYWLSVLVSRL